MVRLLPIFIFLMACSVERSYSEKGNIISNKIDQWIIDMPVNKHSFDNIIDQQRTMLGPCSYVGEFSYNFCNLYSCLRELCLSLITVFIDEVSRNSQYSNMIKANYVLEQCTCRRQMIRLSTIHIYKNKEGKWWKSLHNHVTVKWILKLDHVSLYTEGTCNYIIKEWLTPIYSYKFHYEF